jgi:hypothetical protein
MSMTTNYNLIAEHYKRAKQQPWRAPVEAFTLMKLIGDPAGKAVIDIACWEGFYTRMLRQRGASKVTGWGNLILEFADQVPFRHWPLVISQCCIC